MDRNDILTKQISIIEEIDEETEHFINDQEDAKENELKAYDKEYFKINELYDECLEYLNRENSENFEETTTSIDPDYDSVEEQIYTDENVVDNRCDSNAIETKYQIENELKSNESISTYNSEPRSDRLRKLSKTLPKIIITQSNTSLNIRRHDEKQTIQNKNKKTTFKSLPKINYKYTFEPKVNRNKDNMKSETNMHVKSNGNYNKDKRDEKKLIGNKKKKSYIADNYKIPFRPGHPDFPKRLVSKRGIENVALISNVPFERIRMLNDTFHTLINLRWRWIVSGTVVVHFGIWLVFAVFWYIAALAHYDFEPDPPHRTCVTGGHDFLTIFLASVEAQTTIGFGDRAIDEECPESIFLFIMQLILGTGLSGVLTCVVYAKLTRPEKLSRDGVGFSKKAVISIRDGHLCLMMRAWDLNYDHIISSEFTAHFIHTHRTKESEVIRYYAEPLALQQRQFLLWPVTLLHVIDSASPLYQYGPELVTSGSYEITVSLKGASASMGTFTQSQTSYLPKEVKWGHRFPPVVKYDSRKQKYVIDHKNLNAIESVDTPTCSAYELNTSPPHSSMSTERVEPPRPGTPSSFSDRISSFHLERSSSFRNSTKSS